MNLPKFEYLYSYHHEQNSYVTAHFHNSYELTYYYEGDSSSRFDNKDYTCHPSNYIIYPPNCIHDETHFTKVKVICLVFTLTDDIKFDNYIFFDNDKTIIKLLLRIQDELLSKNPHYLFMNSIITSEIIINSLRKCSDTVINDDLASVFKFINENFNEDIDLVELSTLSGYSYDHFRHLFKKRTGLTVLNYILNKKIDHAKLLLSSSSMLISDIAISCGFCNISQFSVSFKKMVAISPSEYRKINLHL